VNKETDIMNAAFIDYKIKELQANRGVLRAVKNGGQFFQDIINTCETEIAAYEKLKGAAKNQVPLYVVVVEHPYTDCCDSGSYDKDRYYFTDKDAATVAHDALSVINGKKYVYMDTEEVTI
jgi:hypothetical protein